MKDCDKSKEQLLEELSEIRQQVSKLRQHPIGQESGQVTQNVSAQILELLNQSIQETDLVRDILLLIKGLTGIEAAGLRLQKGHDFPYYESNGFHQDFLEKENALCEVK